jgi:hypothetical protein
MKKLFTLSLAILFTFCVFGQIPKKFSYQCVIRDAGGALVTNHNVGMRVTILASSPTGTVSYQETYSPVPHTNANGLVTLEIGSGVPVTGLFANIAWEMGNFYLKTETDPTGGTNYTITGTSQLLPVPFALAAKFADEIDLNCVVSDNIVDGSVLGMDLADNSINSVKIINGSVNTADLADASVTAAKIADNAVGTSELSNSSVSLPKLNLSGAVTDQVIQYNGSAAVWGSGPGTILNHISVDVLCNSIASYGTTMVKMGSDLGAFVKKEASSNIEVTFHGRLFVNSMTSLATVFELRIDNVATTYSKARADIRAEEAGTVGREVTFTGIFPGISTGYHTINMWVVALPSGTGTMAGIDPGCFADTQIILKEIK